MLITKKNVCGLLFITSYENYDSIEISCLLFIINTKAARIITMIVLAFENPEKKNHGKTPILQDSNKTVV